MITVATCSNAAEAELLHSLLADAGIDAFVPEEYFGGAVRLQVPDERAEEARQIIAAAAIPDDEQDSAG